MSDYTDTLFLGRTIRALSVICFSLLGLLSPVTSTLAQTQEERFGDWFYNCPAESACQVVQTIMNADANQKIGSVSFVLNEKKETDIILSAPLGILISPGFLASVDGEELARMPILVCNNNGCMGRMTLPNDAVDKLSTGDELRLNYGNRNQTQSYIPFSLVGFSNAYTKLSKQ